MKIVKLNTTVTRVTYSPTHGGYKSFMLLSDIHWDNPHCDRLLLKKHLDLAKERQAGVFIFGDLFCAMQGKYDPRGSKTGVRPEHNVANYLDAIVEDCAAFWKPYADNLVMVTPGNHETSILKRVETDIVARFAALVGCHVGTYTGWVLLQSQRSEGKFMSAAMAYHHGYGGGGPVTKDVIQASRKAVYLPDADVVVSGHTHDRNIFPIQRIHLNRKTGNTWLREQLHLKLGTYKDEYSAGEGWAVERGMPPKSLGGVMLKVLHQREPERMVLAAELL